MSQALQQKTNAVRRRATTFVWLRAYCLSAALIFAALGCALVLDGGLRSESLWLRWAYRLLVVAASGTAIWKWILPALSFRPSNVEVAKRIEQATGDVTNELSTGIQLLDSGAPGELAEQPLVDSVLERAEKKASRLRVKDIVQAKTVWAPLVVLVTVAAACGMGMAANRSASVMGLQRLLQPGTAQAWPRENKLVFETLPEWVPVGTDLKVVVRDDFQRLRRGVFLESKQGSNVRRLEMTEDPDSPHQFAAELNQVENSFEIRAVGGDDRTDWQRVRVWRVPRVVDWQVRIMPPANISQQSSQFNGALEAWAGSSLQALGLIEVPDNLQIRAASLVVRSNGKTNRFPLTVGNDGTTVETQATNTPAITGSGEYWVEFDLEPRDGEPILENQTVSRRWSIQVFEDLPPRVKVACQDSFVGVASTIEIDVQVQDEFDVSKVVTRLFVDDLVQVETDIRPVMKAAGELTWRANLPLQLAQLPMAPGNSLRVQFEATDVGGQQSDIVEIAFPVLNDEKLLQSLDGKTSQLGKRLVQLANSQSQLADSVQLSARELVDQQNRLLKRITNSNRGTYVQNERLVLFLNRHRLDPANVDKRRKAQLLQADVATSLRDALDSVRADGSDERLRGFKTVQVTAGQRLRSAANLLRSAAAFSKLQQQARMLGQRHQMVVDSIGELSRISNAGQTRELKRASASVSNRHRQVRRDLERLYSELEFAQQAGNDEATNQRLQKATETILTNQVIAKMLRTEQAIDSVQFGTATSLAGEVARALEQLVKAFQAGDTSNETEQDSKQALLDEIDSVVEQLQQLENELRDRAAQSKDLSDTERAEIDKRKKELGDRLGSLQQSANEAAASELSSALGDARNKMSGGNGKDPESMSAEARQLQQAKGTLQGAALKTATEGANRESVDLRATLRLLNQLLNAETTVADWTTLKVASEQIDRSEEAKTFVSLQNTVQEGFQLAAGQLESFATAQLLVEPIEQKLESVTQGMREDQINSGLAAEQRQVIRLLSQLVEVLEIQLEPKAKTPKNETNEDQTEEQGEQKGISSFDLTVLYVLQKALNDETRTLAMAVEANGSETEVHKQGRLDIATRQKAISAKIEQLLSSEQESIPELPDF